MVNLHLVICACAVVTVVLSEDNIENYFEKLLKINGETSHVSKTTPKHMVEIYHEYLSGKRHITEMESTVRSMLPITGKHEWETDSSIVPTKMIFFNVSSIEDKEEVSVAKLHIFRRKMSKTNYYLSKRFLPPPFKVNIYQVQIGDNPSDNEDARTMSLATLPVSPVSHGGWHILDITPILRELLINAESTKQLLLGIRFESPKNKIISPRHFLKRPEEYDSRDIYKSANAYLVVFSEEIADYDTEEPLVTPINTNIIANSMIQNKTKNFINDSLRHYKHKFFKNKMHKKDDFNLNEILDKKEIRHKYKRRVAEEKRAKEDDLVKKKKHVLKTVPFLHQNELEEIRKTTKRFVRSVHDNELPKLRSKDDNELLKIHLEDGDEADYYGYKLVEDNRIRSSKKKKRPSFKHKNNVGVMRSEEKEKVCRQQTLIINFTDMGWKNRILYPNPFEAKFCTGECTVPLQKERHHMMDEFLHVVSRPQPPTCSPDKFSPFTILYVDDGANFVIKNFPHFNVDTCSCR